jgi:hypothetical protein
MAFAHPGRGIAAGQRQHRRGLPSRKDNHVHRPSLIALALFAGAATVLAGCGGGAGSSHSSSYDAGYQSGTNGLAHNTYGEQFDTGDVVKSEQFACSTAFTGEQILNTSLVEGEYAQGCQDAFRDNPPKKS